MMCSPDFNQQMSVTCDAGAPVGSSQAEEDDEEYLVGEGCAELDFRANPYLQQ